MNAPRQRRRSGGVGQRLAAEQRDSLDGVSPRRVLNPAQHIGKMYFLSAVERQHLGIAAAGAAQRTSLKPEGEAVARSLGLGAGNDLRHAKRQVQVSW